MGATSEGEPEDPALRADCSRCEALCCVAFAFDRSQGFPVDKPNGEPCAHLKCDQRCGIYEQRGDEGYGPCIGYDCFGAGQRVVQDLFSGQSWRDAAELLPDMVAAFVILARIHELRAMLIRAGTLPLTSEERERVTAFDAELDPPEGWSQLDLAAFDIEDADSRTRTFLASLRRHFVRPGAG